MDMDILRKRLTVIIGMESPEITEATFGCLSLEFQRL